MDFTSMAESSYASMADSLPYISRSSSDIGEYDSTKNLTSKTPTQSLSSQTSIRSNNSQLPSKSFSSSQSLSTHRPTSSLRPLTTIETPKRLKNKFTCSEGIYTLSSDIPRQPQSTSTGSSLSQRKSTTFPVDLFTTELNANHLHVLYYSLGYYTLEKYKSDGFVDKLASFRVKTPSICCDLHFDQNLGNLMIFGLNNGHILYYDIEHQISSSFNCLIERKPISLPSVVRWVPNNPQRFVAGFRDGTLQVFDVALSDSKFADLIRLGSDRPRCVRQSNSSSNPLVFWLISNRSISDIRFSPNGKLMAVASLDGRVTLIDFENDKVIAVLRSYFAGFTCVCWSFDGRLLLTGGEDDLVSVWSTDNWRIIARCAGHRSWITRLAFDSFVKQQDDNSYRFASVAQDCRLMFWDLNLSDLEIINKSLTKTTNDQESPIKPIEDSICPIDRPALRRDQVPLIEPIVDIQAHHSPLIGLAMYESHIITVCDGGTIKTWSRPNKDQTRQKISTIPLPFQPNQTDQQINQSEQ